MKRFIGLALAAALVLPLSGCIFGNTRLTDQDVENYIATYTRMAQAGISSGGSNLNADSIAEMATSGGFADMTSFLRVQTAILTNWSVLQTEQYNSQMDTLASDETWSEVVNMEGATDEQRAAAQQQLDSARQQLDQQRRMAQPVLNVLNRFTNNETIDVLRRHQAELMAAFTYGNGGGQPIQFGENGGVTAPAGDTQAPAFEQPASDGSFVPAEEPSGGGKIPGESAPAPSKR